MALQILKTRLDASTLRYKKNGICSNGILEFSLVLQVRHKVIYISRRTVCRCTVCSPASTCESISQNPRAAAAGEVIVFLPVHPTGVLFSLSLSLIDRNLHSVCKASAYYLIGERKGDTRQS